MHCLCDTDLVSDKTPAGPTWNGPANQVYANAVKIGGGAFDVMLTFGLQQAADATSEQNQPPIDEVVRVSMSWAHAKSMIPLLARLVADYESKYGEVPAPGFGDNWRT